MAILVVAIPKKSEKIGKKPDLRQVSNDVSDHLNQQRMKHDFKILGFFTRDLDYEGETVFVVIDYKEDVK